MMARTWAEISNIMIQRRRADSALFRRMIDIRDRYNGDITVPMPDVVGAPDLPPLMPQLIYDGIENTALRAASTMPIIECPPSGRSERAVRQADIRRKALYGRWYSSQLTLKNRRAFRQLVGYGTYSYVVMPDYEYGCAKIELRDPLTTYPELRNPDDIRCPDNVGYVFGRSADWVRTHFPAARDIIGRYPQEDLWDMVEWVDESSIVIGLLGPRNLLLSATSTDHAGAGIEIHREVNKAGMVPAVIPRRITLDRMAGQLSAIVPIVDWQARLFALEVIAAERGVFPDMAIFSDNGMPAMLSDNEWKDGRTGEVNFITNAKDVRLMGAGATQSAHETMDRLERAARHAGGVSSQFSGEMTGAIRSGRVASSIAELSIDPRIQELQEIMAYGLAEVNRSVMRVERGYFASNKMVVFSSWAGDEGTTEYVPAETFDSEANVVFYSMPGTDITQTNVGLSQLVAGGMMAKGTARRKHPYIDDALSEERRIMVEQFDLAIISSAQQQIAAGQLPIIDAIMMRDLIDKGATLGEAIRKTDEAARERQAAETPPPPEGMALPPEQMAGIAMPGQGAEALTGPPPEEPPMPGGPAQLAEMIAAMKQAPAGAPV